jgi:hypothetical protein
MISLSKAMSVFSLRRRHFVSTETEYKRDLWYTRVVHSGPYQNIRWIQMSVA